MQMAHHPRRQVVFTGRREYGAGMLNITNGSQLFRRVGTNSTSGTVTAMR